LGKQTPGGGFYLARTSFKKITKIGILTPQSE